MILRVPSWRLQMNIEELLIRYQEQIKDFDFKYFILDDWLARGLEKEEFALMMKLLEKLFWSCNNDKQKFFRRLNGLINLIRSETSPVRKLSRRNYKTKSSEILDYIQRTANYVWTSETESKRYFSESSFDLLTENLSRTTKWRMREKLREWKIYIVRKSRIPEDYHQRKKIEGDIRIELIKEKTHNQ